MSPDSHVPSGETAEANFLSASCTVDARVPPLCWLRATFQDFTRESWELFHWYNPERGWGHILYIERYGESEL